MGTALSAVHGKRQSTGTPPFRSAFRAWTAVSAVSAISSLLGWRRPGLGGRWRARPVAVPSVPGTAPLGAAVLCAGPGSPLPKSTSRGGLRFQRLRHGLRWLTERADAGSVAALRAPHIARRLVLPPGAATEPGALRGGQARGEDDPGRGGATLSALLAGRPGSPRP